MARLCDICAFQSGGTPSRQNPGYFNGDIPWVTTTALNGSTISLENANEWITLKAIEESAAKLVPAHSILVGTRVGVGKVAINLVPMSTSQDIISLIGIDQNQWNLDFLCKFLSSKSAYLNSQARGATIKGIKIETLAELELPNYSIPEQHLISSTFNSLEKSIFLRKQQLSKLDELVKSRFIEMFGDYRFNNKGFECKKGSELFKFSSGKFLPEEKRLENGIPVYGGNGIAWYTEEALIDFSTIIIGRVGAQCGNIHMVTTPVWITDNAIYIKEQKTKAYTLEFLTELMRMMDFYQYADFSGQPKITQKPLETLEYIMPPIELQREYTAFVEQIDKSKFEIQKSLEKLETLKKALMQKYFG